MKLTTTLSLLLATALTGAAGGAAAQDVTATVRTWTGQSLQIAQPSLEVFYTIVSKSQESSGPGGSANIGQVSGGANLRLLILGRPAVHPPLIPPHPPFCS